MPNRQEINKPDPATRLAITGLVSTGAAVTVLAAHVVGHPDFYFWSKLFSVKPQLVDMGINIYDFSAFAFLMISAVVHFIGAAIIDNTPGQKN